MNIVHVIQGRCTAASSNGVDVMVYQLSQQQARDGHTVELWQVTSRPAVPVPNVESLVFGNRRWPLATPHGLVEHIRSHPPDLVHIHSAFSPACTAVGRQLHRLGIPYIVTPHGALHRESLRKGRLQKTAYLQLVELTHLRRARAIHALSDTEATDLLALGVKTPTFVVPNGVDLEPLSPASGRQFLHERIPATRDKRVFLFLGRLATEQKGLDLLIDAVLQAKQDLDNVLVVIAGPDWRNQLSTLQLRVNRSGLQHAIVFPGSFAGADKLKLIAGADVFVHTSRWEGIPMALLEAMASAKPCLLTEATNMAHVIRQHDAGFVADSSRESIAEQLVKANTVSKTTLQSMGARGARAIDMHYRWDTIARRITRHYS